MPSRSFWGLGVLLLGSLTLQTHGSVLLREAIQQVEFSGASGTITKSSGAILDESGGLQTGKDGLADLLTDQTTLRLGGNSSLNLLKGDQFQLASGNFAFANIPEKKSLVVLVNGEQVLIYGGTGFVHVGKDKGPSVLIGGIAGRLVVRFKGNSYELSPGELLKLTEENQAAERFDLEKQVRGSRLLGAFRKPLSDLTGKAIEEWTSLRGRGFIRPEVQGKRNFFVETSAAHPMISSDRGTPQPIAVSGSISLVALFGLSPSSYGIPASLSRNVGLIGAGTASYPHAHPNNGHYGGTPPPHNPNGDPHDGSPGHHGHH
jgi:hypothetical protein